MSLSTHLQDDILKVQGHLDRFHLGDKKVNRFPSAPQELNLCLNDVSHLDTAGLAWILKLLRFYKGKQVKVEILNPPSQLIALAKISNVLELLPFKK